MSASSQRSLEAEQADLRLRDAAPEMLAALKEIAQGRGTFSLDPLEHAANTIKEMMGTASAAIAIAKGKQP